MTALTSKRLEISPSFVYSLCLPLSTISVFIHTLIMSKQRICLQEESKALKVKRALRFVEWMHCSLASWPAVGQPDIKRTPQGRKTEKQAELFTPSSLDSFPFMLAGHTASVRGFTVSYNDDDKYWKEFLTGGSTWIKGKSLLSKFRFSHVKRQHGGTVLRHKANRWQRGVKLSEWRENNVRIHKYGVLSLYFYFFLT